MTAVKIWTTIDRNLKKELKSLTADLGFKSETECIREALRQGVQMLRAQRSVLGSLNKKRDSILRNAGLLSAEYARLRPGELELRIKSQWRGIEETP